MHRIGVLTSGGDAPGMNAALRAVVRAASRRGISVVGYLDGYQGLVDSRSMELSELQVTDIVHRGGTIIGTSRCPAFLTVEGRAQAARALDRAGVDGLVVVGGDGSFRGALALEREHGVRVVGVAGTIDNDVFGTDETIGFDSAVNTVVRAVDYLRDTSEATGTVFFVEVMGRSSGAIAIHASLAAGALDVFVPESQEDEGEIAERIRASIARGRRSHLVVVSEGEESGGAFAVAERIGVAVGCDYRVTVLGHVQRGGPPTARDRVVASLCGALAVEVLAGGRAGVMVGMDHGRPVEVPLSVVVSHEHAVPDFGLLRLARDLGG